MSGKKLNQAEIRPEAVRYTKQQLLGAERYRESRDILTALLKDDVPYSFEETDEKVKTYKEGTVK